MTTCNNCKGPKPKDQFQACPKCREYWRLRSGSSKRKTAPAPYLAEALRILQKIHDLEYGPQSGPVKAVLKKYKEFM